MLPVVNSNYVAMSQAELRGAMADTAIATVDAIVADNKRRLAGSLRNGALLNEGVFYPNEYYTALKAKGEKGKAQLEALVKTGDFVHSRAPWKYFTKVQSRQDATGFHPMRFRMKAGILPTEALQQLRKGLSFLDCGAVCQIGHYEALREVLGDEKFNRIFSADGPNPFLIGTYESDHPLICLQEQLSLDTQILKGQWVYFRNVSPYTQKHRIGDAQGYMTTCCDATPGQERYVTLGVPAGGLKREEIRERLRAAYNETPLSMDMMTEAVRCKLDELDGPSLVRLSELFKDNQVSQEDFDEDIREAGGAIGQIIDWRIELVQRLIGSSAEDGQSYVAKGNQAIIRLLAQQQVQ